MLACLASLHACMPAGDISYARGYGAHWEEFHDQIEPIATSLPYMTAYVPNLLRRPCLALPMYLSALATTSATGPTAARPSGTRIPEVGHCAITLTTMAACFLHACLWGVTTVLPQASAVWRTSDAFPCPPANGTRPGRPFCKATLLGCTPVTCNGY